MEPAKEGARIAAETNRAIDATADSVTASETAATDAAGVLRFVSDVPLQLTVEVGRTRLLVREVLQLAKGSVVELDRMAGDPADVLVNGRVVARGELTVDDDRLCIKIVEVAGTNEPAR